VIDGVASNEHAIDAGVPQGSVLSPTLFLVFINDLLSLTENPIYSFADDSSICHSYSFKKRPNSLEIERMRLNMNDLKKISEWGLANRVEFNASKTQCCLLTHKRMDCPLSPLNMNSVSLTESAALDVLGISIHSDLRWNDHIFDVSKEAAKCLGFLKRCKKFFTPAGLSTIYTAYIRPKMEYNSHIWAGASKSSLELLDRIQNRAIYLIGDEHISSSLNSLGHRRNVGCLSLLYRYYYGKCSRDIRDLMPPARVFPRSTRAAHQAHPYSIAMVSNRTSHYRENSFFSRTVKLWNSLPAKVFPGSFDVCKFKTNIHRHYSVLPPSH
jgi:hypothetical protein